MTAAQVLARRGGILLVMNSLGRGGADRVGMILANGFARAGIPTRVALMRDGGDLPEPLDPRVSVESAGPPMGLGWSAKRPALGHRHLERSRGVRFIRRQIDAFRPAVVLAASDNMGLVTALARRRQEAQTVFALKLTNRLFRPHTPPLRAQLRRAMFKFIFGRLDLVLALTDADRADALGRFTGSKPCIRTVANPYVTEAMLAATPSRPDEPPRLLSAGRMVRQKRFDVLLRAFALSTHRDARLTIMGDGPLRSDLESLARSLGVADRVSMPGYADIRSAMEQSQLFILSSDYEGLPAVLVEALASNVPVVTTDSFHAAREMFGAVPSCAVVPIGDPEALAAAIDECLSHPPASDMRKLAEPYRMDLAIQAHIEALASAVEAQNRIDTPV